MVVWSARVVLRALIETPQGEAEIEKAFKCLGLAAHEGMRGLLNDGRMPRAAERLQTAGYNVTEEMLRTGVGLILGATDRKSTMRTKTVALLLSSDDSVRGQIVMLLNEHSIGGDAGNLLARDKFPPTLIGALQELQPPISEERLFAAISLVTPSDEELQSEAPSAAKHSRSPSPDQAGGSSSEQKRHKESASPPPSQEPKSASKAKVDHSVGWADRPELPADLTPLERSMVTDEHGRALPRGFDQAKALNAELARAKGHATIGSVAEHFPRDASKSKTGESSRTAEDKE